MPMHNLVEYNNNYSKTSGILLQHCRDKLALDDNNDVTDYTVANSTTDVFKIKETITGETVDDDTKNAQIMVPLKYLSNFQRTLKMSLINCKTNLNLS